LALAVDPNPRSCCRVEPDADVDAKDRSEGGQRGEARLGEASFHERDERRIETGRAGNRPQRQPGIGSKSAQVRADGLTDLQCGASA